MPKKKGNTEEHPLVNQVNDTFNQYIDRFNQATERLVDSVEQFRDKQGGVYNHQKLMLNLGELKSNIENFEIFISILTGVDDE